MPGLDDVGIENDSTSSTALGPLSSVITYPVIVVAPASQAPRMSTRLRCVVAAGTNGTPTIFPAFGSRRPPPMRQPLFPTGSPGVKFAKSSDSSAIAGLAAIARTQPTRIHRPGHRV